jgi:preprotein translocase subunit SecG
MISQRWLQRTAALVAVWFMASAVDQENNHWWLIGCFLTIVLVLEFLAFRHGVATGISIYKNATPKQRADLDKIIESE